MAPIAQGQLGVVEKVRVGSGLEHQPGYGASLFGEVVERDEFEPVEGRIHALAQLVGRDERERLLAHEGRGLAVEGQPHGHEVFPHSLLRSNGVLVAS